MVRSALGKVAWVGKTASMVFGLALVMALVVGAASTAWSATGGNFILGKANTATTVSKLTASVAGPALTLVNKSTEAAATALNLTVAEGKAPLKVNAAAGTATGLSADEIDGKSSEQFADGVGGKATDADKLDGIDSSGFVQGSGTVLGNRVELSPPSGNDNVLFVTGFGTVEASCSSSGMRLGFRNRSGGELAVFQDDGGSDPVFNRLNDGGFVYLNSNKVGNELVTLQLLGPNQRLATITATGWAPGTSAPCLFEAQGIAQGA